MKKLILGFILGVLLYPALMDLHDVMDYQYPKLFSSSVSAFRYVPTYGLADPFIKNCTKDVSKNGHGWVFVNREYFKCGKLSIKISDYIYGETTK